MPASQNVQISGQKDFINLIFPNDTERTTEDILSIRLTQDLLLITDIILAAGHQSILWWNATKLENIESIFQVKQNKN